MSRRQESIFVCLSAAETTISLSLESMPEKRWTPRSQDGGVGPQNCWKWGGWWHGNSRCVCSAARPFSTVGNGGGGNGLCRRRSGDVGWKRDDKYWTCPIPWTNIFISILLNHTINYSWYMLKPSSLVLDMLPLNRYHTALLSHILPYC
jgi:hypothetical protein